jgi:hypothetical protein
MGNLTLVEKQRASFIAEQKRIFERNLLKQLKTTHKINKKNITIINEKSLYYSLIVV